MDGQDPNKQQNTGPEQDNHGKVIDEYQAASQATAEEDYDNYTNKGGRTYTAPRHLVRKALVWLLVLALLGAAAFGAYRFANRKDTKAANTAGNNSAGQTKQDSESSVITSESKHYVSAQFTLEFDQPADWAVSDSAGSGKLVARSPALQLKDATGKSFTGQVLLTIRNKQQPLPEFDKGNAVAARESEKIAYTKPSSVQRGSTYLSFLHYAGSAGSDSIEGVYITGDVGYQADQAIPKADFVPVDPVISVTFVKCADSSCNGEGTTTGISKTMWQDTVFSKPIKTMLQSLTIS
jgi:hypothetical protein